MIPTNNIEDPKYRKKVYDVLSGNFSDLTITEQDFYTKLDSDSTYAEKVYKVLSDNFSDFSKPKDEFLSLMLPSKKKDGTEASSVLPESPSLLPFIDPEEIKKRYERVNTGTSYLNSILEKKKQDPISAQNASQLIRTAKDLNDKGMLPERTSLIYDYFSKDINSDENARKAFISSSYAGSYYSESPSIISEHQKSDLNDVLTTRQFTGLKSLSFGKQSEYLELIKKLKEGSDYDKELTKLELDKIGIDIDKDAASSMINQNKNPEVATGIYSKANNDIPAIEERLRQIDFENPYTLRSFGNIVNGAYKRGMAIGGTADILTATADETGIDVEKLAQLQKQVQESRATKAYEDFSNNPSFENFSKNPVGILLELSLESLTSLYSHGSTRMAAGAGTGAILGSVVPGIGTATGASTGVIAGLGMASLNLEYSSSILEKLSEMGVDVANASDLKAALADDKKMSELKSFAYKKSIPVALIDMLSAGVAGKIVTKPAKSLIGKTLQGTAEVGIQGALGGGGAAAGQLVSEGRITNPNEIIMEMVGEAGPGSVEIAYGSLVESAKRNKTLDKTSLVTVASDKNQALVKDNIDAQVASGNLTQDQASLILNEISNVQKNVSKVPEDISSKAKAEILPLVEEKANLVEQSKKLDDAFKPEIQQKIKDIDEKILSITQVDRESKAKELSNIDGFTIDPGAITTNTTNEVERLKTTELASDDGVTLNMDGTKYEGGGLIVPIGSINTTQEELTPELIANFAEQNKNKLSSGQTFKFGLYKFPNSNQVSIDLNIVTDPKNRDIALEFGKRAGQESLFDLSDFSNVPTGADGQNPMSFSDEQIREIGKAFEEGRMPKVFGKKVADELMAELGTPVEEVLAQTIPMVEKSLQKTGIKVNVVDGSMESPEAKAARGNQGLFVAEDGTITIDKSKLANEIEAGLVVWHEASHPVMNIIRNTNKDLYNKVARGLITAARQDKDIADALNWAKSQPQYDNIDTQNDEAIVETIGRINSGVIDVAKLDTGLRQSLIDLVNRIAKFLGIDPILNDTDIAAFKKTVSEVSDALKSGRDISEVVGEQNISQFQNPFVQERVSSEDVLSNEVRGDKKVVEVAQTFEQAVDEILDPQSDPNSRITRFLKNAYEDLRYFLGDYKGDTGLDWYTNKVKEFNAKLEDASDIAIQNGEMPAENSLRNKENMDLFKVVLALSSIGVNPRENVKAAFEIWKTFNQETKTFSKYQPGLVSIRTNISDGKGGFEAPSGEIVKEGVKFLDIKQKNGKVIRIKKSDLAKEYDVTYLNDEGKKVKKSLRFVKETGKSFVFRSGPTEVKISKDKLIDQEDSDDGVLGKGWTTKGNIVAINLDRLENVLSDHPDLKTALEWINSKHPINDLRKYNKGVPDIEGKKGKINPKGERLGSYIIGEKLGAFHQNVAGTPTELTMDLWWSRTWNRYMGTLMTKDKKGNPIIQETPRTDNERNIMREAAKIAADALGLEVHELQAALWYLEQQMYKRMGAAVESYSFVDGINQVLLQYGKSTEEIQPERYGIDSSEADQRRSDAAARAANIVYGESIEGSGRKTEQASVGNRGELLAPNGKPSRLTPAQYEQVRTPQFKNWFGDWENDPKNASKVVDENGEPLVVYHGSVANDIEIFDRSLSKRDPSGLKELGYYFTTNRNLAELYSKAPIKLGSRSAEGKIYEAFLNLRKVKEFNAQGKEGVRAWDNLQVDAGYKIAQNRDAMDFLMNGKFGVEKVDGIIARNIADMESYGAEDINEGFKGTVYLVFDDKKNSIKSATDNSGEFSTTDNRIQASVGNRPELSREFKVAAFIMRKLGEGESQADIIDGVSSVTGMSADQVKEIISDPEQYIRNSFPQLSKIAQDNLIERAKIQNIYRGHNTPVNPAFTGMEVPREKVVEYLNKTNKIDQSFKDSVKDFKSKWLDPARGLPDWTLAIKDFATGSKNIEIARAVRTIERLKAEAKKIGFTNWDAFSKAMVAVRDIKRVIPDENAIAMFDPYRASEGKAFTTPDDMLPAVIPDELKAIPESLRPFAVQMRQQIDGITKDLIGNGYVTPEQAVTLEKNIGQYVNRSYKMFNERGYKPTPDQKVEATKFIADQKIKQLLSELFPEGKPATTRAVSDFKGNVMDPENINMDLLYEQATEEAKKDVQAILDKKRNPYFNQKTESRDTGTLKQKKDIPEVIRKLMGEYTDPGTVFVMTVAKQAALKAQSEYLTKLRDFGMGSMFFEKNDPKRPAEYSVEIASIGTESKSPLGGLYTTPEIAEALDMADPTYNELTQMWMKIVGAVRWGKTVGSVATQFKNFLSNIGFAVFNGLLLTGNNSQAFKGAFKYVKGQYSKKEIDVITEKLIKLNLVGQSVGARELAEMLGSGDIHDVALEVAANPNNVWGKKAKKNLNVISSLNKAYRMGDDFWKAYAYLNEREVVSNGRFKSNYESLSKEDQDKVDIEASERVKNTWPTYDRVVEGAKYVSKRAPIFGNFISFQAESLRVLINSIKMAREDMQDPEMKAAGIRRAVGIMSYIGIRAAITTAVANAAGMAASGILGAALGDDEEEQKKRAIKKALPVYVRPADILAIPNKKEPHRYTVYSLSSMDPFGIIPNSLNAFTEGREGIFSKEMQPGVAAAFAEFFSGFVEPEMTFSTLYSVSNNINPKTGRPVVLDSDTPSEVAKKVSSFIWATVEPSTIALIERGMERGWAPELASFAGARPIDVDLHKSFGYILSDMSKQMDAIASDYGYVKRNEKLSQEEKDKAEKYAESKKAFLISKVSQVYRDFIKTGADPNVLNEMINERSPIKMTGFDKTTKRAIKTGEVNPEKLFK